jgi:putative CocE/NonD family hydrolase
VLAVVVPTSTPLLIAQDSLYIHDHYRKEELSIPMRDGVRLFTSIYFPVDTTLIYPIILLRTPYGVGPYGAEAIRSRMAPSMLEARAGYIFAYQDVRGCYRSEGDFVNVRPYREHKRDAHDVDESSDTFDTIDWLIHHVPHNNGRVAITGISYPGFYAVMGMIDAHPALVAASPQAPIADWFIGDDDHHHGALFLAEAFGFYINFGRPRNGLTTRHGASFNYGTADGYAFFLQMGPLSNANALYMKDSIAFWNETMLHGTYDAFWQQRNTLPHLKNIRPSVMVVGGWFDKEDLYGTLNTYKAIREKSPGTSCVLVMGPWSHGEWDADDGDHLGPIPFGAKTALWYRNTIELPYFEGRTFSRR